MKRVGMGSKATANMPIRNRKIRFQPGNNTNFDPTSFMQQVLLQLCWINEAKPKPWREDSLHWSMDMPWHGSKPMVQKKSLPEDKYQFDNRLVWRNISYMLRMVSCCHNLTRFACNGRDIYPYVQRKGYPMPRTSAHIATFQAVLWIIHSLKLCRSSDHQKRCLLLVMMTLLLDGSIRNPISESGVNSLSIEGPRTEQVKKAQNMVKKVKVPTLSSPLSFGKCYVAFVEVTDLRMKRRRTYLLRMVQKYDVAYLYR